MAWAMTSSGLLFNVGSGYITVYGDVTGANEVRPVVYLLPNVELDSSISNQDGTASNPYILKYE